MAAAVSALEHALLTRHFEARLLTDEQVWRGQDFDRGICEGYLGMRDEAALHRATSTDVEIMVLCEVLQHCPTSS